MPFGAWCTRHKDTIAAFGVIVAAVGFFATGVGLGLTVDQLKTTRNTLQATNAYQIQKDARELAGKLSDESVDAPGTASIKLGDYLGEYGSDKFGKYDQSAAPRIAQIFNFYLAVYRQYKNSGVTPKFAAAFGRDFCNLFKLPGVTHYWDLRIQSKNPPGSEMQEMTNAWCP
jgi:hypothetical protein